MKTSEAINAVAEALAKAQGEMQPAMKDSENPFFKSRYADLASVWNACRDALSNHGLAVIQIVETRFETDRTILDCTSRLMHATGQWIEGTLSAETENPNPQQLGSLTTYLRRYGLSALVGVAPDDDDDGNVASGRKHEDKRQPVKRNPPPTDAEALYLDEARAAIIECKSTGDMKALAEIIKTKPQVIQDALRSFFMSRFTVLKQEEESLEVAAAAAK